MSTPSNSGLTATGEPVAVEKLSAECPTHGTVTVHCPRCLGKRGGKQHKGTTWKSKKELEAVEKFGKVFRQVLDLQPAARMLGEIAEARKRVYKIAEKLGWSAEEAELFLTRIHLNQGFRYTRELSDRMGMSVEERAKLAEDMQKSVALALGNPDEVPAILERYRRKE